MSIEFNSSSCAVDRLWTASIVLKFASCASGQCLIEFEICKAVRRTVCCDCKHDISDRTGYRARGYCQKPYQSLGVMSEQHNHILTMTTKRRWLPIPIIKVRSTSYVERRALIVSYQVVYDHPSAVLADIHQIIEPPLWKSWKRHKHLRRRLEHETEHYLQSNLYLYCPERSPQQIEWEKKLWRFLPLFKLLCSSSRLYIHCSLINELNDFISKTKKRLHLWQEAEEAWRDTSSRKGYMGNII